MKSEKKNRVCILYSGGSDSVLAAAVLTDRFEEIHLLTFTYTRIAEGAERSKVNLQRLKKAYPKNKFVHHIYYLDGLLKEIIQGRLFRDFLKYKLFLMAICPICKIAMHTRTLMHCLDHDIKFVADGANKARGRTYPEQVEIVMKEYAAFYEHYGIQYFNPIYDMSPRTDHILYEMGIYPFPNVKHDALENARIEPNCNYKSLYHTVAIGYYKNLYGDEKFEEITIKFYREKFGWIHNLIQEYQMKGPESKLAILTKMHYSMTTETVLPDIKQSNLVLETN